METILIALLSITIIFFISLLFKHFFPKICAICLAVSGTWILLLVLSGIGQVQDKIIIALLLGQTITGIFYFLEKKVADQWKIFRLPLLLTLFTGGYFVIAWTIWPEIWFIIVLWLIFSTIYLYRANHFFRLWSQKIMECCRRW